MSNIHVTVREIEMLKIPKSTIDRHIQRLGLNSCDLHLKRNEFDPFLKRTITGNIFKMYFIVTLKPSVNIALISFFI